jgi:hypothetical protein
VGVGFGEGDAITALSRADNDVPTELWEGAPDCARVLFQGHDAVFGLKLDRPESARIRALLDEGIRQKTRVWFIAQKPDLTLRDVLPAGWQVAATDTGAGVPTTMPQIPCGDARDQDHSPEAKLGRATEPQAQPQGARHRPKYVPASDSGSTTPAAEP